VTTTDIRTPKAHQIHDQPRVELAWWFEQTQEQLRIAGNAVLVPSSAHSVPRYDFGRSGALRDYDWEQKRKEVFDGLSGHMKASWCRPLPGAPLTNDPNTWPETLEGKTEQDQRNLQEALENFALLLIDPDDIDYVELGVVPNRRTRFVWNQGKWNESALVP
jgi:pyridoxamine 5'-phosphate oxidase